MMVLDMRSEEISMVPARVRHAITGGAANPREMAVLLKSAEHERMVRYLAELSGYRASYPMGPGNGILVLRKAA